MPSREPEERLRRSLEASPEAVARTVASALGPTRRRRRPWLALAAGAAALAAALALPRPPKTEPAPAALEPPSGAVLITNRRGPVTVESPSGPTLVILRGGGS